MIDPDMAPQAGGRAEGALAQATGELFHCLKSKGWEISVTQVNPKVTLQPTFPRGNPTHLAMFLLHVSHILITLGKPGVTKATGPAPRPTTPTFDAFASQVPTGSFGWARRLRGAGQFLFRR